MRASIVDRIMINMGLLVLVISLCGQMFFLVFGVRFIFQSLASLLLIGTGIYMRFLLIPLRPSKSPAIGGRNIAWFIVCSIILLCYSLVRNVDNVP